MNFHGIGFSKGRAGRRPLGRTSLVALALALLAPSGAFAAGPSPGNLPQTATEPNNAAGLGVQMKTLWRAIESDSTSLGRTVFFPRGAYLRMKAGVIPGPNRDFSNRLIGLFDLDLAAYHRLLAAGKGATFLRIGVSPADAAWIRPGACENKTGYWHIPGVRLVFERAGRVESVGVASLISWRGTWYVVHLGPNPRPTDVGTIDNFRIGPGSPGPAGGC